MIPESGQVWLERMQAILLEWRNRLPRAPEITSVQSLQVPEFIRDLVTEEFDPADLLCRASGVRRIVKVSTEAADFVVEFEDSSGEPYRAILRQADLGRWSIRALKFQCSLCFGTGQNDGSECLLCQGTGWGVG
jgi:hypothetical protein